LQVGTNQQFTIRRKTICYGRQKTLGSRFVTIERLVSFEAPSAHVVKLTPQILPSHYLNGQLILRCTAEVGTYYADFTEAPLETTRKEPIPERGEKTFIVKKKANPPVPTLPSALGCCCAQLKLNCFMLPELSHE
jgi:hypothetical protein